MCGCLLCDCDVLPQEEVVPQQLVQAQHEGLVELVEDLDGLGQHGAHRVVAVAHVDREVADDGLQLALGQGGCRTALMG